MIDKYEEFLTPTRQSLDVHPIMSELFKMDDLTLYKFLMYSAAIGYKITAPVEQWLINSADRCKELGYEDLAKALYGHSKSEAGHDQMRLRDFNRLILIIEEKFGIKFASEILGEENELGAKMYIDLHNNTAQSQYPFLQFAIQYEIERLPVKYGQLMMDAYVKQLGPEILDCMEFMKEHVILDVGHTAFNKNHMTKILEKYPNSLGDLVKTGIAALEAYKQTTIDIYKKAIQ